MDQESQIRKQLLEQIAKEIELKLSSFSMKHIDDAKNSSRDIHINRFRNNEGIDYLTSGIGYVFMTKPHLHISGNSSLGDPFIYTLRNSNSGPAKVVKQNLDGVKGGSIDGNFMSIITNSVERFETQDVVLKTKEIGETFYGEKLHWGDNAFESYGGGSLTIEYTEYNDLVLTMLHKAWVDYIHGVKLDKIKPREEYIEKKIIDYVSSIYYFLLESDGSTIRYFAKYTGVFPTSVPYSAMSFSLGESAPKKLSVQYQYSFKDDLDPRILDEFAFLTQSDEKLKTASYVIEGKPNNLSDNWVKEVLISNDRKRLIFNMNREEYLLYERKD